MPTHPSIPFDEKQDLKLCALAKEKLAHMPDSERTFWEEFLYKSEWKSGMVLGLGLAIGELMNKQTNVRTA
jgi:hypothetical protein